MSEDFPDIITFTISYKLFKFSEKNLEASNLLAIYTEFKSSYEKQAIIGRLLELLIDFLEKDKT